jgi:hypothetical protein
MEIGVYVMELMTTTPECLSVSQEEQFRKWKVLVDKLALTREALIPHSIWLTARVALAWYRRRPTAAFAVHERSGRRTRGSAFV